MKVSGQHHASATLPAEKQTRHQLGRRLGEPQGWTLWLLAWLISLDPEDGSSTRLEDVCELYRSARRHIFSVFAAGPLVTQVVMAVTLRGKQGPLVFVSAVLCSVLTVFVHVKLEWRVSSTHS
jgi:hypothetical protein